MDNERQKLNEKLQEQENPNVESILQKELLGHWMPYEK